MKTKALLFAAAAAVLFAGCDTLNSDSDESNGGSSGTVVTLNAISSEARNDTRSVSASAVLTDEFGSVIASVELADSENGWSADVDIGSVTSFDIAVSVLDSDGAVLYSGELARATADAEASIGLVPEFASVTEYSFTALTALTSGRNSRVNQLAVANDVLYAATSSGLAIGTDSGDGTLSWTLQTYDTMGLSLTSSAFTGVIAVAGTDATANTLYLGTAGGLAISTDSGTTWTLTDFGVAADNAKYSSLVSVQGIFRRSSTLYVGTSYGTHVSTDAGATWTTCETGLTMRSFLRESSTYWCATSAGIAKSTDAGASWSFSIPLPYGSVSLASFYTAVRYDGKLFLGSGAGLVKLADDLVNWEVVTTENGLGGNSVRSIVASASGYTLFAATSGGLSVSTDGGDSWVNVTEGLSNGTTLYSLLADDSDDDGYTDSLWVAGTNGLTHYAF